MPAFKIDSVAKSQCTYGYRQYPDRFLKPGELVWEMPSINGKIARRLFLSLALAIVSSRSTPISNAFCRR